MMEGASDGSIPVVSQSKGDSSPKSYANVVSSRPSLSKVDFEVSVVDGKATVAVPDSILDDAVPLWEDFLIGRFPSTAPHVAKIHVIVNKIWNLGDKNIKIDVYGVNDTTVKFRIRNSSARLRALRRGMWNICEKPMVVSKWTPILEDAQPEIKTMPLWVLIKNVPQSMFTWPGLSFLASPVGEPKRLHPDTELVTNFEEAKIFVEVDLTKVLPKTYFFNVRGEEICVKYEYPWLPQRCGICRKWGHPDDGCLANLGKATETVAKLVSQDIVSPVDSEAVRTIDAVHESVKNLGSESELPVDGAVVVHGDVVTEEKSPISSAMDGEGPQKEGEWLQVNNSGSNKCSGKKLVYGQVQIASPTRFEILRNEKEEGEIFLESDLVDEVRSQQVPVVVQEEGSVVELAQKQQTTSVGLRVPPARNSKNTHKFLSVSSQKAKDNVPSNFSKKNSKQKH